MKENDFQIPMIRYLAFRINHIRMNTLSFKTNKTEGDNFILEKYEAEIKKKGASGLHALIHGSMKDWNEFVTEFFVQ